MPYYVIIKIIPWTLSDGYLVFTYGFQLNNVMFILYK